MNRIFTKKTFWVFLFSCFFLVVGTIGVFIQLYYPDILIQILKWFRNIVGKDFDIEVQEYYSRKYILLSATGIFIGLTGVLFSLFAPNKIWKERKMLWEYILAWTVYLGVFLRIYSWAVHFFWNDTLLLTDVIKKSSFIQLFGYLGNDQSSPILFLLISKAMGECFGYTPHVLGFFPLLLSSGSIWLFYKICGRFFSDLSVRCLAMFLFAINISLCFYAGEFKQYSADVFCTLLMFGQMQLALERMQDIKNIDRWKQSSVYFAENRKLLLSGVLVLLLSQASIFIVTSSGLLLFLDWIIHKRGFKQGCTTLFPLLGCWVFFVLGILLHTLFFLPAIMHEYHSPFFAPFPFFPSGWNWYISFFRHSIKYPYGLGLSIPFFGVLPFLICLAGAVHLYRKKRKYCYLILLPLILVYIASVLKQYPTIAGNNIVDSRLILFTVPIVILLFSNGLNFVREYKTKLYLILYLISFFSALSVFITATPFYENGQPLLEKIEAKYKDHIMIYTNIPGKIAAELSGKIPSKKLQCENLKDKNLFRSKEYFPVPGKYWFFCIHAVPKDTCITDLPPEIKITNRYLYPGSLLYELELTKE